MLRRVERDLGRPLLREDLLGPRQDDPGQDPHQGHVRDDQVHLAQQEQRRHPAHVRLQALAKEEKEEERFGFSSSGITRILEGRTEGRFTFVLRFCGGNEICLSFSLAESVLPYLERGRQMFRKSLPL